jgi:hypothetical protein
MLLGALEDGIELLGAFDEGIELAGAVLLRILDVGELLGAAIKFICQEPTLRKEYTL